MRYVLIALLLSLGSSVNAQKLTLMGSASVHLDVNQGDTVQAVFYIQNKTDETLYISQVAPDCQCTAAGYPTEGVAAGAQDSVVLYFYSKNTPPGPFSKTAVVDLPTGSFSLIIEGNCSIVRPQVRAGERPVLYKPRYLRISNR
ncbi:MAG: DUF1573 domain-containing protein [Bacteroidia bacterium]